MAGFSQPLPPAEDAVRDPEIGRLDQWVQARTLESLRETDPATSAIISAVVGTRAALLAIDDELSRARERVADLEHELKAAESRRAKLEVALRERGYRFDKEGHLEPIAPAEPSS